MGASFKQRMPFGQAVSLASFLRDRLFEAGMDRVEVCGSIRREKGEVGDIDMVVEGDLDRLHRNRWWRWVDGGDRKATLEFQGQQVNLLRSDPDHWGAATLYFTGPSDYNIGLRALAKRRGLKLNEHGLFRGSELLASRTEREIYEALGKNWTPPTARGKARL